MNGRPSIVRLDNALVSDAMNNFLNKLNIEMKPTPVLRPQTNGQIERVHRDLRRIFNDLLESLKVPKNRWVEVVPLVSNIVNNVPHSTTKFAPSELQFGRITADIGPITDKILKEKYKKVKERLEAQQSRQVKASAGPFSEVTLDIDEPVYAFLTGNEPIKAKVIKDFGNTVIIRKDEPGRFQTVSVHKSALTRRFE